MFSPRWRKVLRDAWLHKARTVLVILAIALGITGSGAVLDTWSLLRQATTDEFRASNPASATLRLNTVDDAFLARVRALPEVRNAQVRRVVLASLQVDGVWHPVVLFAMRDYSSLHIGVVGSVAGTWPPADQTLVIERSSVAAAAMQLHSAVVVRFGENAPVTLPIEGIAWDRGLAPGWMEHSVYAFVTPATLDRLGAPSTGNELEIVARDREHRDGVRQLSYRIKALAEASGHRVENIDVAQPGRHIHAAQMDSLLFTQGAFGVLALLLSALLVVNLMSAMLAGQVREIGVMKAIGAQRRQLAGMYLGTALVLGLGACAVGMPAAALLGHAYARFAAELLNFDVANVAIPRVVLLLQLAVGALLPVAASAVPVVRGCGITVGEALRVRGLAGGRADRGSRLLENLSGPLRPILFSLRNAFRHRERMVLTVITLATGGAVYLGALDLRASIGQSMDGLLGYPHYDLGMKMVRPYPRASLEAAIRAVPGVAVAEAWSGEVASVDHHDGTFGNSFSLVGPPPSTRMVTPPVESGRWLRPGDDAVVVVTRHLVEEEPALKLGSTITLLVSGRPSQWRVVGVVATGPATAAYAPREAVARLAGQGGANVAVATLRPLAATHPLSVVEQLRDALGSQGFEIASVALVAERRAVVEDHLLMVASFLGVMGQLMMLVGGLGLASTLSIAVLERRREIGVLRAIGARNPAIQAIVLLEGLVIATASWIVAIPLSIPMSVVLGRAFGRILLPVPVTFLPGWRNLLLWLVLVVVLSVLASWWPAWRATKVPTAAALAYE